MASDNLEKDLKRLIKTYGYAVVEERLHQLNQRGTRKHTLEERMEQVEGLRARDFTDSAISAQLGLTLGRVQNIIAAIEHRKLYPNGFNGEAYN